MLFNSSISHDHLLSPLVVTRLVAARRLTPWRHRITAAGRLALSTTLRVPDRIPRHARVAEFRASDCDRLYRARCFHARHCPPDQRLRGTQPARVELRPKAYATARIDLPLPAAARTIRRHAPPVRLCPVATQCCES